MIIHSPFPFPLLSTPPPTHTLQDGTREVAVKVVRKELFKQDSKVQENLERETRILTVLYTCWCKGSSFSGRASCTISFGCSVEYPAMHTTAGGGGERDNGALCCVDGNKLDVRFGEWSEKLTKPDSFR